MYELLLVDGENVRLVPSTTHRLVAAMAGLGIDVGSDRVVVFFGNHATRVQAYVTGLGLDARHLVQGGAGKNAADIALTVEAVDSYHDEDRRPTGLAIGGGDFDFRPLVVWFADRAIGTRLVVLHDAKLNPRLVQTVRDVVRLPADSAHAPNPHKAPDLADRTAVCRALLRGLVPCEAGQRRDLLTAAEAVLRTNPQDAEPSVLGGFDDAGRCLLDGSMAGRSGPLVHVDGTGRPTGPAPGGGWVDLAETGWLAWAGARLLGESRDRIHAAAVKEALTQCAGDRPHLGVNAWALAEYLATPPWFVQAARKAGHETRPSYRGRLSAVRNPDAARLSQFEDMALQAARDAAPTTDPTDVELEWVATVLSHTDPGQQPTKGRVGWTFYYDARYQARENALTQLLARGLVRQR